MVLAYSGLLSPAHVAIAENQLLATGPTVAAGGGTNCAISINGELSCWGGNEYGSAWVPPTLQKVTQVATSEWGTCVLEVSGTVKCWGNRWGLEQFSVVPNNLGTVMQVDVGGLQSCILNEQGGVVCWNLWTGALNSVPKFDTKIVKVTVGTDLVCTLEIVGEVTCWGSFVKPSGDFWERTDGVSVPSDLGKVWDIDTYQNQICTITVQNTAKCWSGGLSGGGWVPSDLGEVKSLAVGWLHTCALTVEEEVKCWGNYNNYGQLNVPSDLGKAKQLVSGSAHSCAVNEEGKVKCWGQVSSVPVGLGPIRIISISAESEYTCLVWENYQASCFGEATWTGETNIPTDLGAVKSVVTGPSHACALKVDGQVRCWGLNFSGQEESPNNLNSIVQLALGYSSCSLDTAGVVKCWGESKYVPENVGKVIQIDSSPSHTCLVNDLGEVSCWGYAYGGATYVPPNLGKIVQVATGVYYTCVLDDQGSVRCWGDHNPAQTAVPNNLGHVTQIEASEGSVCAINSEGKVSCWGSNAISNSSQGLGFVKSVTLGRFHGCALDDEGVATCWGSNLHGQAKIPKGLGQVLTEPRNTLPDNPYLFPKRGVANVLGFKEYVKFGDTLRAETINWGTGVKFGFQWLKNGREIVKANKSSYSVKWEDLGSKISYKLLVRLNGYQVATANSTSNLLVDGVQIPKSVCVGASSAQLQDENGKFKLPDLKGKTYPFTRAEIPFGPWPDKTKVCTAWLIGGKWFRGGNKTSRAIGMSDVGKTISAVQIGTDPSGMVSLRASKQKSITLGRWDQATSPRFKGGYVAYSTWITTYGERFRYAIPGMTLTPLKVDWKVPGARYSWEWTDGKGKRILGGYGQPRSYYVTSKAAGNYLYLDVCAQKYGYAKGCRSERIWVEKKVITKPTEPTGPTSQQCFNWRVKIASLNTQLLAMKPSSYWGTWNTQTALAYYLNSGDVGGAARVSSITQEVDVINQRLRSCS